MDNAANTIDAPSNGARLLDRRLAAAEQTFNRRVEVIIARVRAWCLVPAVAQLFFYPGVAGWLAWSAVVLLLVTTLGVEAVLRANRARMPRWLPWASVASDAVVVALVMLNYRTHPGDAVQVVPLILVVQAAARWGLFGGAVGGTLAGVASAAWSIDVHRGLGLAMPAEHMGYRVVILGLVGAFVGLVVEHARQQRRAAEAVFNASRDLVVTFDLGGRIRTVNPAVRDILGYQPEDLVGRDRGVVLDPDEGDLAAVPVEEYRRNGARRSEMCFLHRDGHRIWLEIDLLPDLAAGLIYAIARDVSDRRRTESELRRRAERDGLTGVWNREALLAHLNSRMTLDRATGLVFIDLDRFKALNDRHGHVTGDQALTQIAQRLIDAVGPRGRVARYAGDEFCVVVSDPDTLDAVVAAVQVAMAAPFTLDTAEVRITASVGAVGSAPGESVRDLVHRADQAMYRAKGAVGIPPMDDADAVEVEPGP